MIELFCQASLFFAVYVLMDLVVSRFSKGGFFLRAVVSFFIFSFAAAFYMLIVLDKAVIDTFLCGVLFYLLWALYTIVLVNVRNSFSLGLLQVFLKKPGHEIHEKDLEPLFALPASINERIEGMKKSGLISEDASGNLRVTPKGKLLAKGTLMLRSMLRITDVG